jgi:TrkA family protein/RyR domain-containing protein
MIKKPRTHLRELRLRWRLLWRHRLREAWRSVRLPLLAGAAILTVVLGYIGFSQLGLRGQESFWDRLQLSLQLFPLESGAREEDVPMSLDVARLMAPIVGAAAAIAAIVALFREQLQRARLRTWRGHVVIAGLGEMGSRLARHLHDAGRRVVVIERDRSNALVLASRERGLPVLWGDAVDGAVLKAARVRRASHLVVTCGDDGANVNVAFEAGRVAGRRSGILATLVHIHDSGLWQTLTAQALASPEHSKVRIAPFNLAETAARKLLDDHDPLEPPRPHLLIVGVGELAEWLVLHAARRFDRARQTPDQLMHITLVDANAKQACSALERRYPPLRAVCRLAGIDLEVERAEVDWSASALGGNGDRPPTMAYVAPPSEADGLASAITLRRCLGDSELPIVLVVRDHEAGVAAAVHQEKVASGIIPFGLLSRTMTPELLEMTPHELVARATHDHYMRAEPPGTSPKFDQLDPSLKESNRRFADGIGEKLQKLDWALVPSPLAGLDGAEALMIPADKLDDLAEHEHERWCRDLFDEGWKKGETKLPKQKKHPKLIPWDELSEEDKDKDRRAVRAVPHVLREAGFDVESRHP